MMTKQTKRRGPSAAAMAAALAFCLWQAAPAGAQEWVTTGGNISNGNSGNVGIGTGAAAPAAKLDVVGATSDANAGALRINNAAAASLMFVRNDGKVGVGTTSPLSRFHVEDSSADTGAISGNVGLRLSNSDTTNNNYVNIKFGSKDVGGNAGFAGVIGVIFTSHATADVSGHMYFMTRAAGGAPAERMRITGAGNVGVGTTGPAYKLDVAGQVRSSSGGFVFPDGTVQATAAAGSVTGVAAGAGLTGGGAGGSFTLDIGAGTGLSAAADSISVNYGSAAGTAVQGNTTLTVTAGDGMTGGGQVTLGAGGALTLTNNDKGSLQNIFKGVAGASGAVQFAASSNNDVIRFEGTGGTTISFDTVAKKVIIGGAASAPSGWTAASEGASLSTTNASAKVGIGVSNPAHTLDVAGAINASGAITGSTISAAYQDVAEWVPSVQKLQAGTVVVLDAGRTNHVLASGGAYDTKVAGVVSAEPGIILGVAGEGKVKVATTGRVKVKVDATRGAIKVGDLLVTSGVEGVAMKSVPVELGGVSFHRPGTIIGKALEPLGQGAGEILVLLSLQ